MTTKTYFLPPDFLSYPAGDAIKNGRIRLGQLIHDINDPASTIRTLPPQDVTPYTTMPIQRLEVGNMGHTDKASSSYLGSLFVKAVGIFGANFRINTSHSEKLLAAMHELQSVTIDPIETYLTDSMAQDKVQEWLNERWFAKRIFMVTSVLIAHPSEDSKIDLSNDSSTEAEGSLEGNTTLPTGGNVPLKGGSESKGTFAKEFGLSFVPKSSFVYGFQVRECFYKKKIGSSVAHHKGAKLHSGKPGSGEQVATKDEAAEFELSGLAGEPVTFDELGDMDEKFVPHEFDGDEVFFVAPKPKVTP
ncbi:hypothetical protein BCR34DRAFT_603179 [Clohesyomyces aquaticus]|uniref:Uncharacterized protein n=1 Tax=Clohesyomyces aquaticus TaxID=1231657 RepID=A0A1Y1ZFK8_9PLEO|nr:hypothetical protein BCR34DRAFT_603179 [Clohesyomyces aquaticus]